MSRPGYLKLIRTGELLERVDLARRSLKECNLCPRYCGVNRIAGRRGACGSGAEPIVGSYNLHFGEEPPISGTRGSGTIFFSNCTMRCIYCQNYPISQLGVGRRISVEELSRIMLSLQRWGAHNINIVTGTHFIPQIIEALYLAALDGLTIPVVFNTSGYDSIEGLKLLQGIVDIYLPDIRYSSNEVAKRYSGVSDYVEHNRKAIVEMYNQVGGLKFRKDGIAISGLIIRHLILPEELSGTEDAIKFIKSIESRRKGKIFISIMTQYFPAYKAVKDEQIGRKIRRAEFERVMNLIERYKINYGWIQDDDVECPRRISP